MAILFNSPYTFMQSLSKYYQDFFVEIDKLILKYMWKCKGPKIVKTIF